jgi:hypothetical protein
MRYEITQSGLGFGYRLLYGYDLVRWVGYFPTRAIAELEARREVLPIL